jgi:hypothetical protein
MVKKIVATEKLNCEHLLGMFLDESHYDLLVESDMDFYTPQNINGESEILFSFRKNYFTEEEQKGAYDGLFAAATISENRGMAAGTKEGYTNTNVAGERQFVTNYEREMMDAIMADVNAKLVEEEDCITKVRNKYPTVESRRRCEGSSMNLTWVINRIRNGKKLFVFDDWVDSIIPLSKKERAEAVEDVSTMMSQSHYGNKVFSGVAGFYDRYPRIPYGRATSYTEHNPEKWKLAFPYLQKLSAAYKELIPLKWANQNEAIQKLDPEFVVPGTVFTTITVNKTFRTAAHRDAGDLSTGFSNLCVITNGKKFSGGYLIFPEFNVAINIRPGDLLLVNNHEGIHGNTPIVLEEEGAERISLVCYFREGMLELGEKKYEDIRRQFIRDRKNNENHPFWKFGWNGVSAGWESSQEWYDYLSSKENGERYLKMYHPEAEKVSLEDLFA